MLEELLTKYIAAKAQYGKFETGHGQMMSVMKAQSDYVDATDELLDFIEKHSETLIAWERQHMLHLSPFDEEER